MTSDPVRSSGSTGSVEVLTKQTLISLSHAIEQAALASSPDSPMIVVAFFQRMPYFGREAKVYERLARRPKTVVVIGVVEDYRPPMPAGVHAVLLGENDPLAKEWAVLVLTPASGAHLSAVDREEVVDWESTLEGGRLFDGKWSFCRDDAAAALSHYRRVLDDQLPVEATDAVRTALDVAQLPQPIVGGLSSEPSLRLLTTDLERSRRQAVTLRRELDDQPNSGMRDPVTRLYTARWLQRWNRAAAAAAGVLPVGVLLISTPDLPAIRERWGARAVDEMMRQMQPVLSAGLAAADRVVRLSDEEFLLLMPAPSEERLIRTATEAVAGLRSLGDRYPFVQLAAHAAVLVTRARPLPMEQLRSAVRWATEHGHPVVAA